MFYISSWWFEISFSKKASSTTQIRTFDPCESPVPSHTPNLHHTLFNVLLLLRISMFLDYFQSQIYMQTIDNLKM